jgi:hypothetical protein
LAHIHHKVMHIHFANLKNPNVLGALGVWCQVWFKVDLQTMNSIMWFLVFGDEYKNLGLKEVQHIKGL